MPPALSWQSRRHQPSTDWRPATGGWRRGHETQPGRSGCSNTRPTQSTMRPANEPRQPGSGPSPSTNGNPNPDDRLPTAQTCRFPSTLYPAFPAVVFGGTVPGVVEHASTKAVIFGPYGSRQRMRYSAPGRRGSAQQRLPSRWRRLLSGWQIRTNGWPRAWVRRTKLRVCSCTVLG